jgi:ATP-dependent 26S proteasome regulatory subunit
MNAEQRHVFSTIVDCTTTFGQMRTTGKSPFFLEGKPGHGKTFVINAVVNHLRARAHIVLIVGSSALAATLYEGGRKAHNLFQIPVTDVRKLFAAFIDPPLNLHSRREMLQFNLRFARF